ncbi:MAG: hypothetical protein J1E00_02760 [Oscillospiraceae bacterium]|nr:hypothetical protein [Oscillospiraceae bacterium]
MKRTLALLLVAIMAITCTVAALSVSAEGDTVYTDKVNLLPNSETKISSDTKAGYSLADGRLSLTRTADSTVAWPSIKYDMAVELDLAETPYLHMSFETSGEGDRGVNGHLDIADANDNVFQFQLSMLAGNSVDDFRDTDELYIKIDLAKAIEDYIAYYVGRGEAAPEVNFDTTGKLTLVGIELSVYGGVGETIVWNALALAKEGADAPETPDPVEPAAPVTVTVTKGDVKFNEETLEKLIDGERALDATAFGNAGLISFQNPGFKDGNATVEITVDLGEVKAASSIYMDFFRDDNDTTGSFISLPSALTITVSADGKDYYDLNAGNAVTIAEGTDLKMNTLAVDFSTRLAINVRYIKAVVTFDNEWIFLSEIGAGPAAENSVPLNPSAPFAYTEGTTPRYGIGVYTEPGEYDLRDNSEGAFFQNSQIIIAAWDETVGAYKINRNTVNPWPNGYDETATLKEGEIMVVITTQGNINAENEEDTIFAGVKWIARGLKEGDYVALNTENQTLAFYPSTHNFTAPSNPQPGTSDTSDTTSDNPGSGDKAPTGDTGMILFVVLSVVALAGVAVTVKARN